MCNLFIFLFIYLFICDTLTLINVDVGSNRKLLAMLLSKRGFEVSMAEDGLDCLRVLNEFPPDHFDLVFMDNTMPNMTGIECVKVMRQKMKFASIIVGLTGNSMEEELVDFQLAGCDLVLTKPLRNESLDELLSFLRQMDAFMSKFYENKAIVSRNANQSSRSSASASESERNSFQWQPVSRTAATAGSSSSWWGGGKSK